VPSRNAGKTWDWSPDAVEEDLNRLIERRAKEAEDANHAAQAWAESARRYNLAHSAERRAAWVQYHRQQAERHRAALAALVARHEAAAAHLAADGGGGPDG
jgi:acyl-CoA reductase-like NAD-dependent aldehyde dehydrogenase